MKQRIIFAAVCAACCLAGAALSQQARPHRESAREPQVVSIAAAASPSSSAIFLFRAYDDGKVEYSGIHPNDVMNLSTSGVWVRLERGVPAK